jgi:hypothetical protein
VLRRVRPGVDKASLLRAGATIAEVPEHPGVFVMYGGVGPGRVMHSDWLLLKLRLSNEGAAPAGKQAFAVTVARLSGMLDSQFGASMPQHTLLPLGTLHHGNEPALPALLVCTETVVQSGQEASQKCMPLRLIMVNVQQRQISEHGAAVPAELLALAPRCRLLAVTLSGRASATCSVAVVAVPRSAIAQDTSSQLWVVESTQRVVHFKQLSRSCSFPVPAHTASAMQLIAAERISGDSTRLTFVSNSSGSTGAFCFWQVVMPSSHGSKQTSEPAQASGRTVLPGLPKLIKDASGCDALIVRLL